MSTEAPTLHPFYVRQCTLHRGFLPEMITSQIMSAFYYISGTKASEVIGVNDTCLQKQQQQLNTLFFFFISLLTLFVYDFQTVDVVFVYRKRIYWKKA